MRKTLLFAGLLALLAGPSLTRGQSLGDVARAEEARRKLVKQPAKVYTNDDLKRDGGESRPVPAAQPAATTKPADASSIATPKPDQSAAADPSKADGSKKDEKYWKDRMTGGRAALAQDKVLIDALQSRVNALTTDFVNTSDPAQRAVVEGNRRTALTELDRLNKDVNTQTKAIADIEEEARKASVPAAWLR
jgi:hypothetical protein